MRRALVFVLAAALLFVLTGCKETLFARLSEQQANQVVAALSEAGIQANKSQVDENFWQVSVDEKQLGQASRLLQSQGIPHSKHVSMGETFKKDGLIPSVTEERIRYVYSLSEELSVTLRKIPGVVDARVHVVIPRNDPLATRIIPSSASVFIKYRTGVDIGTISPNIKDLVAASVEGLDIKNVALFTFPIKETSTEAKVGTLSEQRSAKNDETFSAVPFFLGGLLLAGLIADRRTDPSTRKRLASRISEKVRSLKT
jgi:type III secretion protein J